MEMTSVSNQQNEQSQIYLLDDVLRVVGKFGRYQVIIFLLICLGTGYANIFTLNFVFTAGSVKYRCRITECEYGNNIEYSPKWIESAIPFENGMLKTCVRYASNNSYSECISSEHFNNFIEEECTDVVFDNYEKTIVKEFNLTCDDTWKAAFVGTIHNTGHFLNLMISGYFSDKYGRKKVFIFSTLVGGILPIIRSFAWSYLAFTIIEFTDALLVAGIYTAGYILALEILSPELRAIGGVIIFSAASIGKGLLGLVAWWLLDWKLLLRIITTPAILLGVIYIFVLPESFRWLKTKGRHEEVAQNLIKVSKLNRAKISEDLLETFKSRPQNIVLDKEDKEIKTETKYGTYNIREIFQYPKFCLRIAICAYCWITNLFVYYGLSLTAVAIGGNKFSDYVAVSFIEIPATFFVMYTADRLGRRYLLIGSLFVNGVSLLTSAFIPDVYWVKLTLFLIGKFSITVSFSTMYTYTSEIFPTNYRHTLLGFCSGLGRLGTIVATQATFLQTLNKNLPAYLFSGTAIIACLLSITFPETLNMKLPDSIEEALQIGRANKKVEKP